MMSDDLVKRLRVMRTDDYLSSAAAARIEELEAKLSKAVEALKAAAENHRVIAGMDLIAASAFAYNAARSAEAALAELKGQDDVT